MLKLSFAWAFIAVSVFWGCRQVVEIDVPLSDQRLVLNAVFNPDSALTGAVSYSRHILDEGRVTPAPVQISVRDLATNQPVAESIKTQNGFGEIIWESPFRPLAGRTYELRVTDQRGKTAHATVTVPAPIPLTDLQIDTVRSDQGIDELQLQLRFTDPPGQRNFYQLFVFYKDKGFFFVRPDGDTTFYVNPSTRRAFFRISDAALGDVNTSFGELLFDDAFFDGQQHAITIRFSVNARSQQDFRVFFQHVSPEYYRYMITTSLQYRTTGDPFAQPVLVFSNVTNGFGIVGALNQTVRSLD